MFLHQWVYNQKFRPSLHHVAHCETFPAPSSSSSPTRAIKSLSASQWAAHTTDRQISDTALTPDRTYKDEDASTSHPPRDHFGARSSWFPHWQEGPGETGLVGRCERGGPRPPPARPGAQGARGQGQSPDERHQHQTEGLQQHSGRAGEETAGARWSSEGQKWGAGGESEAGGAGWGGEEADSGFKLQDGLAAGSAYRKDAGQQRQRSLRSPSDPGEGGKEGFCGCSLTR